LLVFQTNSPTPFLPKMSKLIEQPDKFADLMESPFRLYALIHLFYKYIGDVKGKSVIDFGCGDGSYCRKLKKELGAKEVVGIDINEAVISRCNSKEKSESLGIKYILGDITKIDKMGEFEVAIAISLLNCAETKENLFAICSSIFKNLKPGSRFLCIIFNPQHKGITDYSDYYLSIEHKSDMKDGDIFRTKANYKSLNYSYEYIIYTKETIQNTLETAGFKNIIWHQVSVAAEGIQKFGIDYWKNYLIDPMGAILTAET